MFNEVTLSAGLRTNLLNLQNTAALQSKVGAKLASGKKVNSALDNPTNFFTAASLSARAGDLSNLLDGLSNGIQTLQAADNALTAITKNLESMQSTVRQARQDKSYNSQTYTVTAGGISASGAPYTITTAGGSAAGASITIAATADTDSDGKITVDEIAAAINGDTALQGKITASNDNGKLRIKSISTLDLTLTGADAALNGGASASTTIAGNEVRTGLVDQFNQLRDQLDKLSEDAGFNGVNLLQGDLLTLVFNESGTSTLDIQRLNAAGTQGEPINSTTLGLKAGSKTEFQSDSQLDTRLDALASALNIIRGQASTFGSNLSMVENRQEFSKNMINTLKTGADNLTLADQNEEAANMLSLQTRQQLSQTALSLANQANQGVLRLFG